MRDLIVMAIILGAAPICLFNPYFGVLMWAWVSYFNPHRYTWGFASHFPVAVVIAVSTLVGLLFARDRNRRFITREAALLLLLWGWFAFTLYHASNLPVFADHVAAGQLKLQGISKILLMTFATVLLVTSAKKLKYLVLVTGLSFGVRAIVGAAFALRTGGASRIYGPPNTFIEDNNDFALALNMALPMMFFLAQREEKRWLRLLLRVAFYSSVVAVVFTYSRGGILGLFVVLTAIATRAHKKFLTGTFLVASALMILSFAPAEWEARMGGLSQGKLDESARERLSVWKFAWTLVKDQPVTGGGFESFTPSMFRHYQFSLAFSGHGPHSVYFQLMGEQGFVGLGLFLLLLGSCGLTLRQICRHARGWPALEWMVPYSNLLETSLLAYAVSGAFLGRAYFDLLYQLIAFVIVLRILYRRETVAARQASVSDPLIVGVGEPAM